MAGLRDYSGKIVIDEGEAKSDINDINAAKTKIAEARAALDPSKLDESRMRGATKDALAETLAKICEELETRETKSSALADFIDKIVATYQRIDRELKRIMAGGA